MLSIVSTSINKEAKIPSFETSFQNIFLGYIPEEYNIERSSNNTQLTRDYICGLLFHEDRDNIDIFCRKILTVNNQALFALSDTDRANIITIAVGVLYGTKQLKRQESDILNIINTLRARKKPSLPNHTPSQVERIVAMIPLVTTPSQLKYSVS